ncbi:unnamed protein product [Urochloa humidicola]
MEMRDDDGHIKLPQLQLPSSSTSSLAATASSCPPPQIRSSSHTCGYCKREFRSAQGLGGHMNVHRLDRARLIHHQCSSHRLSLAAASPPNPNHSRTVLDLLGSGRCRCSRTHSSAASDGDPAVLAATKLGSICRLSSAAASSALVKDIEVMKNLGMMRMGACSHGDGAEERLDLELRLGNS